jgi:signal transduction histidine kinase
VHLALTAAPDQIGIVVTDTGVGIDPEFVPHLFDAFHQESTGDAREFEGSGLGLSITKRLVNLMGGTITVDSTKGEGTTFTVTLPRAIPGRSRGESAAGP